MRMQAHKNQTKNLKWDERGFASIVIALILIIVLSLLTIGFAQLARREQQTALAKQLADQANYAAESGINDAYYDITHNDPATVSLAYPNGYPYIYDNTASGGGTNASSTQCMSVSNPNARTYKNKQALAASAGVSYSCLLVDLQPPAIKYDDVASQSSRYLTFNTDAVADSFTFFWGSTTGRNTFPPTTGAGFQPIGSWSWPSVLQVSVTPLSLGTDRATLIKNTFSAYLYPASGGVNSIAYNTSDSVTEGSTLTGHCNTATSAQFPCQATISGLTGGTGPYLIHIVNYYDTSDINIDGQCGVSPVACHFIDGQAVVDVTGRAKNVLKRLQEHIPIHPNAPVPSDAIEGLNVCKRFDVYPNTTMPDSLPGCDLN
jgi:Tfp pilus assembly protein PilX